MGINYRKNELEERMLMNLNKKAWTHGLELDDASALAERNQLAVAQMVKLAHLYNKSIQEEVLGTVVTDDKKKDGDKKKDMTINRHVGKQDPKRHLHECVDLAMADNITQILSSMVDAQAF